MVWSFELNILMYMCVFEQASTLCKLNKSLDKFQTFHPYVLVFDQFLMQKCGHNEEYVKYLLKGAGGRIEEIKLATAMTGTASNCSHHGNEHKK